MAKNDYIRNFVSAIQRATRSKVGETISQEENKKEPKIIWKNGKITDIILSQSLLSKHSYKGERIELCWRRLYHEDIIRDVDRVVTESMLYGLYFETKCLGTSRDGKYEDLPRKQNGEKTIAQVRIDEQVFLFHQSLSKYEMILDPRFVQISQRRLLKMDGFEGINIWVEGTLDFMSPFIYETFNWPKAVVDLKLTKDRFGGFGKFSWAYPDQKDHIQPIMYTLIFEIPFLYWVFDFKPQDRGERPLPVNTNVDHPNRAKAQEARLRFKEVANTIRAFCADVITEDGLWRTNPGYHRCKSCPVLGCKDRKIIEEI